jgi:hypothetical protein
MSEDVPSQSHETTPARKVGAMASMIAALTALVLISIVAFWVIGTQMPPAGNPPAGRIVVATEAAKGSPD